MIRSIRRWVGAPIANRARRLAQEFLRQAAEADRVQRDRLLSQIRRHADSAFGRAHGFSEIRSPEDFRRRVPIRDYDGHEPYLARVREGETSALFAEGTEILMFAMTSGTTARPKTIPVTREALQAYRDGWRIWGILAFDAHDGMIRDGMRPILQLASDWKESRTPSGIPCGAITGLTAAMQHPLIRLNYCMPPAASRIRDVEAKYYVALRLSAYRNVGALIAANPSTLLGIARLGDREKQTLIRDLFNGTIDPKWDIPEEVRLALRARSRFKRRAAARRLEEAAERQDRLLPKDFWPDLEFVANWTGGTMGAYLRQYPDAFGEVPVRDPGLIASEGRMTIPVEDFSPAGILDYRHHYFEFIPESQEDAEQPETVEAADLIEGQRYFILLTTHGGLYRYQIRDLVQCVGFEGKAPLLVFLNKGSHISSLTGEKLSEFQVVAAVKELQHEFGLTFHSFILLPSWGDPPSYSLLVERQDLAAFPGRLEELSERLDRALCRQNVEYENKRETLRLGRVRVRPVADGSWNAFRSRRLASTGGTLEQYKQPCLLSDLEVIGQFSFVDAPEGSKAV
ncbi:GH3 auxin-responsive promoter family protein [Tautonia sociabilis]|uniref:GH3 auxin-responsive promoter family protein n=1 Tax=Tautonia sociabilis TaxID=2080755 RepID=A0A432MN52_9BACT|nr:GH3 auxin-responsive promoter family protein [Tautonia sociabilis]RUL88498.1 GH3 auxin-responsive promoter family protein [Tautonia sociabilis]